MTRAIGSGGPSTKTKSHRKGASGSHRASGSHGSRKRRHPGSSSSGGGEGPAKRERAAATLKSSLPFHRHRTRLLQLLRKLNDSKNNPRGLFSSPVDAKDARLPNYNAIIARPMDLGTVKTNVEDGGYDGLDEVERDLRLTFENALQYHEHGSSVRELAENMVEELNAQLVIFREGVVAEAREEHAHSCEHCHGSRCADPNCRAKCLHFKRAELYCSPAPRGCGRRIVPNAPYVRTSRFGLYWCQQCYGRMGALVDVGVDERKGHDRTAAFLRPPPPPKLIPKSTLQEHVHNEIFREPFVVCVGCEDRYHVVCAGHVARRVVEDGAGHCLSNRSTSSSSASERELGGEGDSSSQLSDGEDTFGQRRRVGSEDGGSLSSSDTVEADEFFCRKCRSHGLGGAAASWSGADAATPSTLSSSSSRHAGGKRFASRAASSAAAAASGSGGSSSSSSSSAAGSSRSTSAASASASAALGLGSSSASEVDPRYDASALPQTDLGSFMEKHLHKRMREQSAVHGLKGPIPETFVRIVSCAKHAGTVPGRLGLWRRIISPSVASAYPYRSRVIALFNRIDQKEDVLVMLLYVQEFGENSLPPNRGCVYISYLDSVPFMRPRALRTTAYHALLDGYWRHARARGYHACHLWACPSSRNQPFILHAHPKWQRIPSADRLRRWYMTAINMGCDDGIVSRTTNLHDEYFSTYRPFVNLRARPHRKDRPKPTLMVRLKYLRDPCDPTGQTLSFFAHAAGLRKVNRIVKELLPPPVSPPSHRSKSSRATSPVITRRRNLDEVPVFTEHFWVEEAERILAELESPPLTRGSMSAIERLARRWWKAVRAEAAEDGGVAVGVSSVVSNADVSGVDVVGGVQSTPNSLANPTAAASVGQVQLIEIPAERSSGASSSMMMMSGAHHSGVASLRPPPLALTRVLGESTGLLNGNGASPLGDDFELDLTNEEKQRVVEWFMSRLAAKIKPMRDGFFMLDLTKEPSPLPRSRSSSSVGNANSSAAGGGGGEGFGAAHGMSSGDEAESSDEDKDWYATKEAARRFSDSKARTKSKIGDPCFPPTVLDTRLGFLAFCQRHHCQVRSSSTADCCRKRVLTPQEQGYFLPLHIYILTTFLSFSFLHLSVR